MAAKPTFFRTPADFRAWLERNHATAKELVVSFYKNETGRKSITWPESVDEALCFGWIDGTRHRVEQEETRQRRLAHLIESAAKRRRIGMRNDANRYG